MSDAIRYWAAVEKAVYKANTKIRNGNTYYIFHGGEVCFSTVVGEVVRHCATEMEKDWIIFQYVPVPSSMHNALWNAHNGGKAEEIVYEVRVHEKFSFPRLESVTTMTEKAPAEK
jgi:hypothetical protein